MAYSAPTDADQRPIAIDGAGTLGQLIAAVELTEKLAPAVEGASMVVEAVPERIDVKREVFAELTTSSRRR